MNKKEFVTVISEFTSEDEFTREDQNLIELAKQATKKAYAPYSNFTVGASVLLENGVTFAGNNQENAAYPSGLCAERVTIFYANAQYPEVAVKTMALCASNANGIIENPATPCGSCRQVLLETELRFNKPIKLILIGKNKIFVLDNISQLLPLHFEKDVLTD